MRALCILIDLPLQAGSVGAGAGDEPRLLKAQTRQIQRQSLLFERDRVDGARQTLDRGQRFAVGGFRGLHGEFGAEQVCVGLVAVLFGPRQPGLGDLLEPLQPVHLGLRKRAGDRLVVGLGFFQPELGNPQEVASILDVDLRDFLLQLFFVDLRRRLGILGHGRAAAREAFQGAERDDSREESEQQSKRVMMAMHN